MVRDALRTVREVVPMVAVAVLVCHLIRTHLLEWYLVPSSSMEPTLHGNPSDGDLVLVNKTAFWFREPERFEMVVLLNHEDPPRGHLVKRVVARGDEEGNVVRINEGDVFLGPSRQQLQRVAKDPLEATNLRHTHFAFPELGARRVSEYFRKSRVWSVERRADGVRQIVLNGGAPSFAELTASLRDADQRKRGAAPQGKQRFLPGHFSTRRPVDTTFLDETGERFGGSELSYRDIGMEVDVEIGERCLGLQMVFEYRDRYYAFQYEADGRARWLVGDDTEAIGQRGAPLTPGQAVTLSFGYLDGRFFLVVQGELLFHQELTVEDARPRGVPDRGMHNLLHLGAVSGSVTLRSVRVFHDVYYKSLRAPFGPPPTPSQLEPDELYLLGDNTFESRDSRSGRSFPRSDLVGRPLAVIGPVSRMRWLDR